MSNSWFRLYAEFASDPKVQMLSEAYQRRLVMVFCIKCNGGVTLQDEEIAFQLRISNEEWADTKAVFMLKNFINSSNEVINWNKRQFVSDSSAARVARHREKKKQQCNVTVTPPDTDTDTDTDKYKKTRAIAPPDGVDKSVWADFVELRKSKKAKLTQTALDGITSEADKAGWTLENALRECCSRGWTGFKADWVADKTSAKSSKPAESFRERDDRLGRERWEEMTGRIHPGNTKNVININPVELLA